MVEKTGRPGYLQIADDLRAQIRSGSLAPGAALPSTAQLGQRYDVSASVVKAAISVLRTEGLIVGQQGKGVFVREDAAARAEEADRSEQAGSSELMEQLAQMRGALADLGERIADLEKAVFREPKRSR
ncbi:MULTISPECIES: winged helix-turn-helix domain-containing protein [Nonomuraea]|uniref:Winged helix-turn-helix domain-containing protein n=1 Tax=Nonomuraea corallina TaxID=2989783 RepID=A0ABT4S5H1_9ACTN|nr:MULTISPECIES: winged helix-turn-helix domain-containing protein [Nonomuraea]MDA0632270.1 winged helix-turn-helix domain-containing protein [Nonomuraea corallina]TXK35112.1 winged helix-turn-helix transcriptional regulator [Nonomuraea sp. C10]